MKIESQKHIEQSINRLKEDLSEIKAVIEGLDEKTLNQLEGPKKWSILQTLQHLTLANTIYVKNIDKAFEKYDQGNADIYQSHWKGDWFTRMISPKEEGVIKNKMKTVGSMAPKEQLDAEKTISEFFELHEKFIDQMNESRNYNLNKVKVTTGFGPLVKLRLGDVFNFLIGHIERHIIQMKRIKAAVT